MKKAICNLIVLAVGLALSTAAFAQQLQPPKIVAVRVGLADRYKAGVWTQVEVTLLGGSEMLTGELSVIVPDHFPSRISSHFLDTPS